MKYAIATLTLIILILSMQNCGRVDLIQLPSEVAATKASVSFNAQGCVNSIQIEPEKTKFIFVIDLSRSNMGEFYKSKYLFNGVYYDNYWFFNKMLGTDVNGIRFDAISDFVSTCGQSSSNDYAVIGFSNSAGTVDTNGSINSLSCKNNFMSSAAALAELNKMKQIQKTEETFYEKFKEPDRPYLSGDATEAAPLMYKETNYIAATDCISSTISEDLAIENNQTSNYQVFFISDGEAKSSTSGCEATSVTDKVKCYTEKMNTQLSYLMKLSNAKSKPIRIHSLYYTANGNPDLSIEAYLKYISAIGQTNAPINLGSLSENLDQDLDNPFCKLMAVDKSIVYRSNKIYAVNTTTINQNGKFKKDSDADGVSDDEEILQNSDPGNARSIATGVLDGVCKIIGSNEVCAQQRSQITCDENKINLFNISDCDIKILKLDKVDLNYPELVGIDSDNDGIPDYVEIVKGLSPNNNDSYLDYDGDTLTNMQEISMGLDPFNPDQDKQKIIESETSFKDQIESCTSGGWELNINNLSGVDGKNNLLFYFKTESKNTQGLQEFRIAKTQYNINKQNISSWMLNIVDPQILPSQFQLVPSAGVAP